MKINNVAAILIVYRRKYKWCRKEFERIPLSFMILKGRGRMEDGSVVKSLVRASRSQMGVPEFEPQL